MLPRAGFSNDALFVHAPREQHLAQRVVDLVCAGVKQVFAFQINFGPAAIFSQSRGVEKRRRAAGVVAQQVFEFRLKRLIVFARQVRHSQVFERRHQGFRHKSSAVSSPVPQRVRLCN